MTPEARQAIETALWPTTGAARSAPWVVFDCARDPAVHRALLASRLEFRCLYSGSIPRELELVAPHLVELPFGHRLAQQWLDDGWGASWGVALRTSAPDDLRHQLRKLLRVNGPDGRKLLFRWYDPRVLRAFLPTADAVQRRGFFGDIEAWHAEDGTGGLLEFRLDSRGAVQRRAVQSAAVPA